MEHIPEEYQDLLKDESRVFMYLATLMTSGDQPQVTPVWFNYDGEYILINSVRGRVKDANMRANRQVACLLVDPNTPYRFMQIMGTVEEITEEGAVEHIKDLALKYRGKREYDTTGQTRVIYKIRPRRVFAQG